MGCSFTSSVNFYTTLGGSLLYIIKPLISHFDVSINLCGVVIMVHDILFFKTKYSHPYVVLLK